MVLRLTKFSYSDIKVGDVFSFEKTMDEGVVKRFAEVSEDFSPLHVDAGYGERTEFGANVVHGMLLGSLFSALVGMLCPGESALYLSQTLNFRRPVIVGSRVTAEARVVSKSDAARIIELETRVKSINGEVLVDGVAMVKVRGN
ncbi:MAG: MaoC family dehydratase [bacterium]|nr:MaoC family dehydratase [bacterium]